jgi:K+-sensing histidine kinase KdpD
MLKLLRALFHEPLLTGLVIFSILLVVALLISAVTENRRNRKMMERRERARRQNQLYQRQAALSNQRSPDTSSRQEGPGSEPADPKT